MLKCAFYEKEITPPLGCHIPGYFNLREGSDVKDRLFARAMVVANAGEKVAILSIDGCSPQNELMPLITGRIQKYTSIPEDHVLIAYSHSHTAIPRSDEHMSEESDANAEGYAAVFTKWVADCAILADMRLQDSTAEFAKGNVEGISFCRDYFMKNSTPRTNPPRTSPEIEGPVAETDNELPVLLMRDTAGKPMGAVLNFACHLDCVGGTAYSGDYLSEVSRVLKSVYGPEFVTVFLLGACGDINHFDVSVAEDAPDHYVKMGRIIAGEAVKALAKAQPVVGDTVVSKKEWVDIPRTEIPQDRIDFAKHIVATVKEIPGIKIAADGTAQDQYDLAMSKILLKFLDTSPEVFRVPLQFVQIGDVKMYAFNSEIYCHFGKLVKAGCGTQRCFIGTLCNACHGYVPTRDLFYDTIYESLPGSACLSREAGYLMAEKLVEMGK